MFDFIHEIFEAWMLEAASEGLSGFKRSLVQGHLKSCTRCRSFALDLVEFSHAMESRQDGAKLNASERENLHAHVMAAFHRERAEEKAPLPFRRASGPLLRPAFAKAMAVLVLIIAAAVTLSYPFRNGGDSLGPGNAANLGASAGSLEAPQPTATPTPAPQPKAAPMAQPTPAGQGFRTENR